jgi:hypothetical protein
MMKRSLVSVLFSCAFLCAIASVARAQEAAPPPSSPPAIRSSSSHSGGPWGFGGIAYLAGPAGLSVAFDPGPWHIDTLIGASGGGNRDNVFQVGGRFWYHLATAGSADFSVGGGLSYEHRNPVGAPPAQNNLFIEPGALIRIFLTSNVALSASTGFVINTVDAEGYNLGATNLVGSAALHYFF